MVSIIIIVMVVTVVTMVGIGANLEDEVRIKQIAHGEVVGGAESHWSN